MCSFSLSTRSTRSRRRSVRRSAEAVAPDGTEAGRGGGGRARRGRGRVSRTPSLSATRTVWPQRRVAGAQRVDRGVSLLEQEPGPALRRGERGVGHAQVAVLEGPPALQDTAADGQQRPYGGEFVEGPASRRAAAAPWPCAGWARRSLVACTTLVATTRSARAGSNPCSARPRSRLSTWKRAEVVAFGEALPAVRSRKRGEMSVKV